MRKGGRFETRVALSILGKFGTPEFLPLGRYPEVEIVLMRVLETTRDLHDLAAPGEGEVGPAWDAFHLAPKSVADDVEQPSHHQLGLCRIHESATSLRFAVQGLGDRPSYLCGGRSDEPHGFKVPRGSSLRGYAGHAPVALD